ncbi:unnamed protein product [Colias eurytheme]|nr:unnamed protein product [Colias eurytheme]
MFGVIFFCAVLALAKGQSTPVEQCNTGYGDPPINAYLEGCTTMPCRVPLGENAVIDVVFESPRTIRSMKTVARASLGPIAFNYTLGENEVTCNNLENTYCPLQKGEIVQYTLRMFIEPVFPTIGVQVDFLVEDEDQIPLWCIRIRIQVVDSQVKRISNSSTPPASNSLLLKYLNATKLIN